MTSNHDGRERHKSNRGVAGDEFKSVADAIEKLRSFEVSDYSAATEYKAPFGTWFRGHSDARWSLTPGVFRTGQGSGKRVFTEETSMFHHFQLRVSEHRHTYKSTFDWLCLMQHYDMPTRLLDWTESVLVALFFAVGDDAKIGKDGRLYVLNARRLNGQSSRSDRRNRASICTPTSYETALRAKLAISRNLDDWLETIFSLGETECPEHDRIDTIFKGFRDSAPSKAMWDWLASPIAVFPARLNGRMVLQSSMFTLHGGKVFRLRNGELPKPGTLEDINDSLPLEAKFMRAFQIKSEHKPRIRDELLTLGIHSGSLFPELDKQAAYIKEQWRFEISPVSRTSRSRA